MDVAVLKLREFCSRRLTAALNKRRRSGGVATPQLRPFCAPSLVVSNTADGQSKPRLKALPAMDASMSNGKRFKGKNKKATGQAGQKNRRYGQWGSMQRMEASQGILIGR